MNSNTVSSLGGSLLIIITTVGMVVFGAMIYRENPANQDKINDVVLMIQKSNNKDFNLFVQSKIANGILTNIEYYDIIRMDEASQTDTGVALIQTALHDNIGD
jgi:hypothetical protein